METIKRNSDNIELIIDWLRDAEIPQHIIIDSVPRSAPEIWREQLIRALRNPNNPEGKKGALKESLELYQRIAPQAKRQTQ